MEKDRLVQGASGTGRNFCCAAVGHAHHVLSVAGPPSPPWAEDPIGASAHLSFNFLVPGRRSPTSQPDPRVALALNAARGTFITIKEKPTPRAYSGERKFEKEEKSRR